MFSNKRLEPGIQLRDRNVVLCLDIGNEPVRIPGVDEAIEAWICLQRCKRKQHAEIEVGVLRRVLQKSGDLEIAKAVGRESFADRVLAAEVLARSAFRQHHGAGLLEGRLGISLDQGKVKQVKESGLGNEMISFIKTVRSMPDRHPPDSRSIPHTNHSGNLRNLGEQCRSNGPHRDGKRPCGPVRCLTRFRYPIDSVRVCMKRVKTYLILHIEENDNAAGEPDREPHNVDRRITLLLEQVAQGNFQIVGEHRTLFEQV